MLDAIVIRAALIMLGLSAIPCCLHSKLPILSISIRGE